MSTIGAQIEFIAAEAARRQRIPGLSVGVSGANGFSTKFGYGYRNAGEKLPAQAGTLYRLASLTKQFTAAAILRLEERGALKLMDDVRSYFHWLPYEGVKIHHLLSHTSGIPNFTALDNFDRTCPKDATPQEVVGTVLGIPQVFAPGEAWQYSNTNYILLGMLIERVSGEEYETFLKLEFFNPLGMDSTMLDDPTAVRADYAEGYASFCMGPWEAVQLWSPSWEFSTGGLCSTVDDMLKWSAALRSGKVISEASWRRMTTPAPLNGSLNSHYGFGVQVLQLGGGREIRHTGGLPGLHTESTIYPELGADIVVLCNIEMVSNYYTITRPVLELLSGVPQESDTSGYGPTINAEEPQSAKTIVRAILAGEIGSVAVTERFRRFLRPKRMESLKQLATLGTPESIHLEGSERWAQNLATFTYRVELPNDRCRVDLRLRNSAEVDHFNAFAWDGKP